MAGLKNGDDFARGERFSAEGLRTLLLMVGGVALGLFLILAFFFSGERHQGDAHYDGLGVFAYSWLFGLMFFLTLTIGGIFWTLLHNATNSGWGTVVRRLFENLGSVFLVIFALGIPLIFLEPLRDALWEWIPERAAIEKKAKTAAKEQWQTRLRDLQADQEKAKQEFTNFKAAKEAAMQGASPNDAHYIQREIAAREAVLNHLLEKDLSEGAIRKQIKKDTFLDHHHGNVLLWKKSGYLNWGFWIFRFFAYAAALGGIIYFLRGWSLEQDETGDPMYFRRMRRAACGFLPLFAASWTFLVVDWLMALDYTWFSTMWGVYLFAGSAQASMAFLIILLTLLRRNGKLTSVVTMEHYHLMGKLLLAFTIFWAYIAFSQFFLIWYANITEETRFYLTRNTEFWNSFTITFLVIGHFILPFAVLLIQQWKKKPLVLSGVAGWVLLMHFMDLYFIIIPERGPSLTGGHAMRIEGAWFFDILAWVVVGCIFGWFLLRQLSGASLFPCRDPRLDESLNVSN